MGESIVLVKEDSRINDFLVDLLTRVYRVYTANVSRAIQDFSECKGDECIDNAREFINSMNADINYLVNNSMSRGKEAEYYETLLNTGRLLYGVIREAVDAGIVSGELHDYINELNPDDTNDPDEKVERVLNMLRLTPWVLMNIACKAYGKGTLNEDTALFIHLLAETWTSLFTASRNDALTYLAAALLMLTGRHDEAIKLLTVNHLATEDGLKAVLKLCTSSVKLYELGSYCFVST